MKLLVIGGTRFVGRHIVEAAQRGGHEVTLFNRGQSGTTPPGVTLLRGDRRADLSALASGRWDAVIDCCGYLPGEVAAMGTALQGRAGRYVFISSVSVYAAASTPNDEASPLGTIADGDTTVVDGRTYGPLKALCESEVQRRFGSDALVLRLGLVVGPHDPTQRFTWWPARLARAARDERVLAPGRADDAVQWIDARDLADFVLHALAQHRGGVFNVASAAGAFTIGQLLNACARAAGVSVHFVWRDMASLIALGIAPWSELPLTLPDDDEHRCFMSTDTRRAHAAGLRIRPLEQTVVDTLAWWRALSPAQQVFDKAGLSAEREAAAFG